MKPLEASTKIVKQFLGLQDWSPCKKPVTGKIHGAMGVKLKLQWEPRKTRESAMSNDHQGMLQAVSKASKREAMLATVTRTVVTGLAMPLGAHIPSQCLLGSGVGIVQ
jgi:hypothetical protein